MDLVCIQVVLQQLSSQDYASLRQASRLLCKHITQHVPYISLMLSGSSTRSQLQQWHKATKRLRHVSCLHFYVAGEVPEKVFDAAMLVLSQHRRNSYRVTELHLLAASTINRHIIKAVIPTVQPLERLLPHLQALVIDGITVESMTSDLEQLAATAATSGSPLQRLTLNAYWSPDIVELVDGCYWRSVITSMMHVVTIAPELQQLSISLPPLSFERPQHPHGDDDDQLDGYYDDQDDDYYDGYYDDQYYDDGDNGYYDDDDDDGYYDDDYYDDGDYDDDYYDDGYHYNQDQADGAHQNQPVDLQSDYGDDTQLKQVAVVASIINAVIRLVHLSTLTVDGVTNIWAPTDYSAVAAALGSLDDEEDAAAAAVNALLDRQAGLLHTVRQQQQHASLWMIWLLASATSRNFEGLDLQH